MTQLRSVSHPVQFVVESPPPPRNRLTVAFRPILAVPHLLMVGAPGLGPFGVGWLRNGALGLVAAAAAVINWFAILFTGEPVAGLLDLQRFYLRWRARVLAYVAMLRDEYPPFGDGLYPAAVELPPTDVTLRRDRLTVGLRPILIIPHLLVLCVLLLAWAVTALIGWFAVLFTKRYPDPLWKFGAEVMSWLLRVEAYALLLHDEYPPFALEDSLSHSPSPRVAST